MRSNSGVRGQLVGLGLLGRELEVDEIVEHVLLPRRAFELLRQAGADVGHRVSDVLIGDRRAVDLGQHLRIGQSRGAKVKAAPRPSANAATAARARPEKMVAMGELLCGRAERRRQ